jgi:hypothetical protein
MKKFYASCLVLIASTLFSGAQVSHLVISQVYGGGGNSGATYNRDFVELFNPTASPVSLAGYSIQYSTATGSSWTSRALSGTVAAFSYFLVQMTTSGTNGSPLPTPDLTVTNTDLSGTAGKLALVNSITALSGSCPGSASIVDFVGYGTSANCWEGSGTTSPPGGNANSLTRASGGCTDADNNATDFTAAMASARNSASPPNSCTPANSVSISGINSTPFCVQPSLGATGSVSYSSSGTYNGTFTTYLSDASGSFAAPVVIGTNSVNGINPSGTINITIPPGTASGTGYRIRIDASSPATTGTASSSFEIINGAKNITGLSLVAAQTSANATWSNPASCFDQVMVIVKQGSGTTASPTGDGSAYIADPAFSGTGTAFDGGKVVYKGSGSGVNVTALMPGGDYYFKVFVRYGTSWSTGTETHVTLPGGLDHLVISQVYAGGGNTGATYTNDFVEIFNPTNSAINLAGYSIQYAAPASSSWITNKVDLAGTIAAHGYFLLQLAGGANGAPLITADQAGAVNMSISGGKVALFHNVFGSGVCPVSSSYIDLVGFGSADCREGSTNAVAMSNTSALFRSNGGCIDTDNNSSDFSAAVPVPRNSASTLNYCFEGAALPVRYSSFRAIEKSSQVQLSWTTEAEENISTYIVERSADGRSFKTLGELPALNHDQAKANYLYLDKAPVRGYNYYRVRAVEKNGNNIYSPVIRVSVAASLSVADKDLLIAPNPLTGNELGIRIVSLPKGIYVVKILNAAGQEIADHVIVHGGGPVAQTILLKKPMKGIYCLRISDRAQMLQMQKQFLID